MSNTISPSARPDGLPDKFWDARSGAVRADALLRSYLELERALGAHQEDRPAHPGDYQINVDDILEVDDGVNRRMFDEGFTNRQAQLVYDLAAERLLPMVQRIAEEFEDARQLDKLIGHFGSRERLEAMRPQLVAWGKANLTDDVFAALASSAEGVIALHEMMQNREPGLGGTGGAPSGQSEKDLRRLMADPRYWREQDPAVVEKVRNGFRALYPDKG